MSGLTNKYKHIMITGGTGFLGQHLKSELLNRGYTVHYIGSHFDLTDNNKFSTILRHKVEESRKNFYQGISYLESEIQSYDYVINLAAVVGGIGANQERAAEFTLKNLQIGLNVVEGCLSDDWFQENGKLVQIGTVCSYPKYCPAPFKEEDIWNGYPEETNAGYGIAKKSIMELCIQLSNAGQLNAINLIPVNLYGTADDFNPKTSHVIPALIRKFDEAVKSSSKEVIIWGTGEATREFLNVKDAAIGIANAMELHNDPYPVNLGSGKEIKIRDLAELIAELTSFDGSIVFDKSKPDGQPRRLLNTEKAEKLFNFKASVDFKEGLKEVIKWYRECYKE